MTDSHPSFDGNRPVEITVFDPSSLDSPEDIMREKLDQGFGALEICEAYLKTTARQEALDTLSIIAAESVKEKRRGWHWDMFIWLSGFAGQYGISAKELADSHKVSKQAFQQAATRFGKKFKFPQTSAQRSEGARKRMREAYKETHDYE